MKIDSLIHDLQNLQKICPNCEVYFTDENEKGRFETSFQSFNIDEENNCIEMLFGAVSEE